MTIQMEILVDQLATAMIKKVIQATSNRINDTIIHKRLNLLKF
jgi:hypothetical protein